MLSEKFALWAEVKPMAVYKYAEFLEVNDSEAFDRILKPGDYAPWAGIYRCTGCGSEIGLAGGHVLPAKNHHKHTRAQGRIRWRLVVSHLNN